MGPHSHRVGAFSPPPLQPDPAAPCHNFIPSRLGSCSRVHVHAARSFLRWALTQPSISGLASSREPPVRTAETGAPLGPSPHLLLATMYGCALNFCGCTPCHTVCRVLGHTNAQDQLCPQGPPGEHTVHVVRTGAEVPMASCPGGRCDCYHH